MNKKETHHICEEHLVEQFKSEGKVACEKCIKAYKLPKELLGKEEQRCWWCNIIIWNHKEKCISCGTTENLVKHHLNPNLKKASLFNRFIYFITFGHFGRKFEYENLDEVFFCNSCHLKEHQRGNAYIPKSKGVI